MQRSLIALTLTLFFAGVAWADDMSDCMNTGDAAIRPCTKIITSGRAKREDLASAYDGRGASYLYRGDLARALADFDKAIEINPSRAAFYDDRGVTYTRMGQYDRALADFDKLIAADPSQYFPYIDRGLAYNGMRDYDRAIADFNQAQIDLYVALGQPPANMLARPVPRDFTPRKN